MLYPLSYGGGISAKSHLSEDPRLGAHQRIDGTETPLHQAPGRVLGRQPLSCADLITQARLVTAAATPHIRLVTCPCTVRRPVLDRGLLGLGDQDSALG